MGRQGNRQVLRLLARRGLASPCRLLQLSQVGPRHQPLPLRRRQTLLPRLRPVLRPHIGRRRGRRLGSEKLTAIDPAGRTLSYVLLESSVGSGRTRYEATIKVVPDVGDGGGGAKGCSIEWSFVAHPVVGWGTDGLLEYIDSNLKTMAQRMEEALGSSDSAAA